MMDFLERMTKDDITSDYKELVDVIGLAPFKQLISIYGGTSIYIPKAENFRRDARNDEIRGKFTGYNYRQLALDYGLTEVTIRNIVADLDKQMKADPMDGQLSLI